MNDRSSTRKQAKLCLPLFLLAIMSQLGLGKNPTPPKSYCLLQTAHERKPKTNYEWTTDHIHVGVRWQPFIVRPKSNAYDATRPIIANDSSYAQFWVSWAAAEPTPVHTDYAKHLSPSLREIERAVETCLAEGFKVEFVFFHCPAWASESGQAGGFKPKKNLFEGYVKRIATYFKGRVHAYQLSHEANLQGLMNGADIDFIVNDILIKGAQAIRTVYEAEPRHPVLVSTTGMSPCETCATTQGLDGTGGRAVNQFYDVMIATPKLMKLIDALNLNVSDQNDGYGNMDGSYVPSVWGNYDLARRKLDAANFRSKSILSAESWISWDDGVSAVDVNGDGLKNEKDAYHKTVTILGQCLQRGLNTINLPWSDNSSGWAMGLTKRRDYNGRIKSLKPEIVIPANDGGADIVTRKVLLRGNDDNFTIEDGEGNVFTIDDYVNPPDPNHLHYYIWKWYAQIAGGSDEVIRHALAGEIGNDIVVTGPAFTGNERYRISSYNRTRNRFTVLVYASGANGKSWAKVSIPSRIRTGYHYNNEFSRIDFRGEGFSTGDAYYARIITKDISIEDGSDINPVYLEAHDSIVPSETLTASVPNMNKFTAIEFVKRPATKGKNKSVLVSRGKQKSAMFRRMDTNGDRKVTREEYVGLFVDHFPSLDKDHDAMLTVTEFGLPAAFKHMDTDRDGKATLAEYKTLYSRQFDGLDKNQDGLLTIDEM